MNLGFTGTRKGMSGQQVRQLRELLEWWERAWLRGIDDDSEDETPRLTFRHGDARGADKQANRVVEAFAASFQIVRHPNKGNPLARNIPIVDGSDIMVAAPFTDVEELRGSGTWHAVRYARRVGKTVIMLARGTRREGSLFDAEDQVPGD